MTVIVNLINLEIFACRVVHYHHVIVLKVCIHELLIERERSIGLLADEIALGIVSCPLELSRRYTQTKAEYAVHFLEHIGLHSCQISLLSSSAELESVLAEQGLDLSGHS